MTCIPDFILQHDQTAGLKFSRVENPNGCCLQKKKKKKAKSLNLNFLHIVRGCRFVQFSEYLYCIFLTSESYIFICHCQPNTQ